MFSLFGQSAGAILSSSLSSLRLVGGGGRKKKKKKRKMIFQKKFCFVFFPTPPPYEVLTYGSFLFFGIPGAFWDSEDSWGIISSSLSSLRLVGGAGRKKKNERSFFVLFFFFFRPPPSLWSLDLWLIPFLWDPWSFLGIWGFLRDHLNLKTEQKKIEKGRRGKLNFSTNI